MFEILNAQLTPAVPTLPTARPDVHFFALHGERVLFDANSLCAVRVDAATFEKLKAPAPVPPAAPAEAFRGLLFSREKPQFRLARATPVRRVVLNVTHACNLACTYCFAKGRTAPQADRQPACMPLETALKGVGLIEPGAPLDVAFFGGEPLLAWARVREVMEATATLAAARRVPAKFHITTNALALDAEKLAFLAGRACSLLVSLDGPEAIHNAARPARRRRTNSFRRTLRALQRAARTPLAGRIMARATFTADRPRLVERLEFLARLQDDGLINGFSIEPAVLSEGCAVRQSGGAAAPDWRKTLAEEYHAAAEWYVARRQAGRSAGFFHFQKLTDRILHARHAGTECGAGNGYITVGPGGALFACHRENGTGIGHVDYGIDEEARAAWTDNRLYRRRGCAACWARYLCGGGCRQACLELAGDLHADTPDHCFLHRTLLEECLWILTQLPKE